jgi:hypothetical protein
MFESGISNWRASIGKQVVRMNKLTLTDLKNHLALKSGEELIQEIAALCQKFPQVRDYYQVQGNAEDELEQKCKNLIRFRY